MVFLSRTVRHFYYCPLFTPADPPGVTGEPAAHLLAVHAAMDKRSHIAMVFNHLGQFRDSEIDGIVERFNALPSVPTDL
jgi:hypothetical protein